MPHRLGRRQAACEQVTTSQWANWVSRSQGPAWTCRTLIDSRIQGRLKCSSFCVIKKISLKKFIFSFDEIIWTDFEHAILWPAAGGAVVRAQFRLLSGYRFAQLTMTCSRHIASIMSLSNCDRPNYSRSLVRTFSLSLSLSTKKKLKGKNLK